MTSGGPTQPTGAAATASGAAPTATVGANPTGPTPIVPANPTAATATVAANPAGPTVPFGSSSASAPQISQPSVVVGAPLSQSARYAPLQ